jgi:hypothetical protein
MTDFLDAWMSRLALGMCLMGAGLVVLGDRYGMAPIMGSGFASIGIAAMISGLESIITRKAAFVPWSLSGRSLGRYASLSAVLWGMLFLVFGGLAILAGAATALYAGGLGAAVEWVFQSSLGWLLLGLLAGLLTFSLGLIRVLSGKAYSDPSLVSQLRDVGERLGGLVMMLAGLGMAVAGLVAGVAPGAGLAALSSVGDWLLSLLR